MTLDAVSPAPSDDIADRLARLEAENELLRARLDTDAKPEKAPARRGGVWRGILSALCIVLASVLVSVSIVGGWARAQLVDEDRFVATFAPLAEDPQVQALVIDRTTAAIEENLGPRLTQTTDALFNGLAQLDLPPLALTALEALRQPAANAVWGLVDSAVTRLVQSDAFADVWAGALRASHRALVAAASGGTANGAVDISDTGEIGIQLAPIIEAVKQRLVDAGITIASGIPVVDRTIVVAQASALVTVATVYNIAVTVGWWLPFVTIALFLLGIAIARDRRIALLGSAVGLALGGAALGVALAVGGSVLGLSAASLGVPSTTLTVIYQQIIGDMERTAWITFVVGVIVAVLAWVQGRSRAAQALRSTVGSANQSLRGTLAERGMDTRGFGSWMYAQRVLVRIILSVLLVVWLLALRPLSLGDVLLVLIVGLLVWWICEIVQKRPDEALDVDGIVAIEDPALEEPVTDAAEVAAPTP